MQGAGLQSESGERRKMKIKDRDGNYWVEREGLRFWSPYKENSFETRDFFILKAFILYLSMRLSGKEVYLEK